MANLISAADGNLTSIATVWDPVSTGTGAVQQTRSASTNTTTSYVYSSAFTGTNLDVVDGLLLYCQRVNSTGTIDVALSDDNGTTATRSVQINASDLPLDPGWVFFKFGSSLTLDGGVDYKVGIKGSSAGNATFFRNGTAGNWSRLLRKTGLTSASAGDVMYIVGEHTAAGAITTRTITMDSTATTDYGTGTDGAADNGIEIGDSGILDFGATASTNYYLKLSGSLNIWANGKLNIGTTGTPIPRNSSAVLEFDPVADGGMGLIANKGSFVNIQGLSRTSGKNIVSCKLNTDEAINSTSLGVDTDTGWLDNDVIAVASSTRTAADTESGTLNGNAGASSLTVDGFAGAGGGLAAAHSGTSPNGAEIILITRNIVIRSATSTIMTYVFSDTTATVDIDWAEFYYLGENATNKRGIEIGTTTGSFNMQYSCVHDTEDAGLQTPSTATGTIVISNNTFYNLGTVTTLSPITLAGTLAGFTMNNNIFLKLNLNSNTGAVGGGIVISSSAIFAGTFTNNTFAGCPAGGATNNVVCFAFTGCTGTIDGVIVHSNACVGIYIGTPTGVSLANITSYRNTGVGLQYGSTNPTPLTSLSINGGAMYGNTTSNIRSDGGGYLLLRNMTIDSDASFSVTNGITNANNSTGKVALIGCSFSGISALTNDVNLGITANMWQVDAVNCLFAGTNEFITQNSMHNGSYFRSNKHDQSGTTHKALYQAGTIASDQTTRHTASGYSWKMTPLNATRKLILPGQNITDTFKVAVKANALVTIDAYVQKDGTYNGNAPRLVLLGGILSGIASDVTDALSVGASTWEQLEVTGTPTEDGVLEFYLDCDGTAGNIYVDDMTITQA